MQLWLATGKTSVTLKDKTERPHLLEPDTEAEHDAAVAIDPESRVSTAESKPASTTEPAPLPPPPALPPVGSVAQQPPELAPAGVGEPKSQPVEQLPEKGTSLAETAPSNEKATPALRPEPVNRPTFVSSPSRPPAPLAAPPLPNPPPSLSSADDNEDLLQGALFELEEPSAEYPG